MAKAWIKITCKECGRTFEHTAIKGNRADADSYEEWAKEHITICPECLRKYREEEEAKKVSEIVGDLNIPELAGSEKQVSWATSIRYKRVEAIRRTCKEARELFRENSPERIGEADEVEHKLLAWISCKNDAKFFIDTRNEDESQFYDNHRSEWDV